MPDQEFFLPDIELDGIPELEDNTGDQEEIKDENQNVDDSTENPEETETEDVVEIDEPTKEVEDETTTTDEESLVAANFGYYNDNGFFDILGDNKPKEAPKTEEEFWELINKRNDTRDQAVEKYYFDAFIKNTPDYLQKVVDATLRSPNPVSKETFLELVNVAEQSQELDESQFEDETFASDYIREDLKAKGHDDEELIEDIIATYKDKGVLVDKAKALYQASDKSSQGNAIINKFVESVNKAEKQVANNRAKQVDTFINSLESRGWRKDVVEDIKQQYTKGTIKAQLQAAINSPELWPDLFDWVRHIKDNKFDREAYLKDANNSTKKAVERDIEKKSYLGKRTKTASSTTKKKAINKTLPEGIILEPILAGE